jgi:hypothetical protein
MTRPTEVRIDRLVLPASERHRADAFRAALTQSLSAELGHGGEAPSTNPTANRAAQAVAAAARRSDA